MSKIAVVTDSASNLPPEISAQYGITIVPVYLYWGDTVYHDGVDIKPDEVYRRLRESQTIPHTAAPSAGDFLHTYLQLGQKVDEIVSIHLPATLSSVIESAHLAARLAAKEVSVRVVDAGTAAMGAGFVALAAARAAAKGAVLRTVLQVVDGVKRKVIVYVIFDTLKYVYRSGRIGRAASLAGAALQIKPIIYLNDGIVDVLAKPRTYKRAIRVLLKGMADRIDGRPTHVAVMHADAPKEAESLREQVEARFNCLEVLTTSFTPVMGISTGPGLVGVAFYSEDT